MRNGFVSYVMYTEIVVHESMCAEKLLRTAVCFRHRLHYHLVARLHGCWLWHCRILFCIDADFHGWAVCWQTDLHSAWWHFFLWWVKYRLCGSFSIFAHSIFQHLFIITSAQLHCILCALADLFASCRDLNTADACMFYLATVYQIQFELCSLIIAQTMLTEFLVILHFQVIFKPCIKNAPQWIFCHFTLLSHI